MSPQDLRTEHFEIILTLEGIVPETGNNIQVQCFVLLVAGGTLEIVGLISQSDNF